MNISKNILFYSFLFFSLTTKEQNIGVNLVNNPSFEEYYNCPVSSGELNQSKYWWGISCEYYNACAAPGGVSVPSNFAGFQYAHTGVAYAGFIIYNNSFNFDYREAIKTKLNDSLIANKRYCTNFYISLAEQSLQYNYVLLDSIGMLFTKDLVPDTDTAFLSNGVRVQNSIFNIDTVSWFKILNSFIANGGEQYLTIGNFDNIINWPSGKTGMTYVFVDDVSVCECSFNFSLGNDTTLCVGETLILKPNMINAKYTWQDGSTDSIYKVTHAGTYWVSAYFADYNITTTDTINISYINCDTTDNIISIYPNPAKEILTIETNSNEEHRLEIFNIIGQTIYSTYIYRKGIINTSSYSSGVYILKLNTDKGIIVRKFVKE